MGVKDILNKNGFVFKKRFGQNFLLDNNVLDNITKLGKINKKTLVIEVGVGAAALTKKLCEKAGLVIGYEIDKSLESVLKEILLPYDNVNIIYDDFLKRTISSDIKEYRFEEVIVVANLPYYITTPIISKFINENINVSRIIVMVQNEVADRFCASTGSKDYNSLTIFLNYYFDIKKVFVVSRNVFYPKPNVDSAVVVFEKKDDKIKVNNQELFFKLVKDAFKQKRKTLKNNLKAYDLTKIEKTLNTVGKNVNYRAEQISIEEFALIANNLG